MDKQRKLFNEMEKKKPENQTKEDQKEEQQKPPNIIKKSFSPKGISPKGINKPIDTDRTFSFVTNSDSNTAEENYKDFIKIYYVFFLYNARYN